MANRVEHSTLEKAMAFTDNIRNFCILAHVDHGKTTLSDSLVSSNGLFSQKLAGKLRFLDSTEEEQKRGITMHSSAISLLFRQQQPGQGGQEAAVGAAVTASEYLMNLVDSPGHIDFSSDVSTATRLCDGALILVDVLEGVCTQTHAVLYKALKERMRPCLVLNKLDRMILEMKLSPLEAFRHLKRIVENVNALAYSLVVAELRAIAEQNASTEPSSASKQGDVDFDDPLFEEWSFAPERANVVFASAIDCWGFGLIKIANIWSKKLDINKGALQKYLFEEYAYHPTEKKLVKCDPNKPSMVPMFVKMILEPIWQLYDIAIEQSDPTKAAKMAARALGVEITPREINAKDPRMTVATIMNRWLPLPDAILRMAVRCMPSPADAQKHRLRTLLSSSWDGDTGAISGMAACSADSASDCVVFVSKMVPIGVSELTPRDKAILERKHEAKNGLEPGSFSFELGAEVLMALCRVFSGTLQPSSTLHVIGRQGSSPSSSQGVNEGEVLTTIPADTLLGLYLCLGPSVSSISEVPAGNIAGVIGLEDVVLKTATLASNPSFPPLRPISFQAKPMLRVAVEPEDHRDLSQLDKGLQLLYQFDPVVEVDIQSSGEHTITCLGELHLELCLKLLREKFGRCGVKASEPLVAFRETIVPTPSLTVEPGAAASSGAGAGLANSEILSPPWSDISGLDNANEGAITISATSGELRLEFQCVPMPGVSRKALQRIADQLRDLGAHLASNTVKTGSAASVDDTDVFGVATASASGETTSLWTNGAAPASTKALMGLMRDALFPKDTDDEDAEADDVASADDMVAAKALRRVFPEVLHEEEEDEAGRNKSWQALMGHTVAIGPQASPSNFLVFHPEISVKVWPHAVPEPDKDKDKDGSEETSAKGAASDEQGSPGVAGLSSHAGLVRCIWSRLHSAITTGFHKACTNGPLMHEPLEGVVFCLKNLDITVAAALGTDASAAELSSLGGDVAKACTYYTTQGGEHQLRAQAAFSGQLISDMADGLHLAMLSCVDAMRVVEPIYSCSLQCDAQQVGNLYGVLYKRRGQVQDEDVIDGTTIFTFKVYLPVLESFGFSQELLKKTSGMATAPQLEFSHWQVRDADPFWKPKTTEELEDHGELASEPNGAKDCIDKVRRRKGLPVEEKLVEKAEKQRTLNKKK